MGFFLRLFARFSRVQAGGKHVWIASPEDIQRAILRQYQYDIFDQLRNVGMYGFRIKARKNPTVVVTEADPNWDYCYINYFGFSVCVYKNDLL